MSSESTLGYRSLDVWQLSMELAIQIYQLTKNLTDSEKYGLISQMQRAAVSVPSNLAKGYGRGGGDYRRHVSISRGSLMELETQIELTLRIGLLTRESITEI